MKSVNIASVVYTIKYTNNLKDENGKEAYAITTDQTKTIEIDNNLTGAIKQKTILHEIIEAMNNEYPLHLNHSKIELLETALYDTFKRNDLNEVFK